MLQDDLGVVTAHWRSTLAGTLAALCALLFLGLLGLAMALTRFNAATAATEGALPAGLGRNVGMWAAFSLLIAFTFGGFVAARLESVRQPEHGAWRGGLVFVLASPLLVWLLLGGLAGAAVAVAATVAGLHVDPATQARVNPTAVGDVAGHLRDATWFILFGCVLGLAGSAIGGMLAAPRRVSRVRLDETARMDAPRRETVVSSSPADGAFTRTPRAER